MEQPDYTALKQLLQSTAGMRLLELVQQQNSPELQNAMAQGDLATVKNLLSGLLQNPEAQGLMEQLRRK